MVLVGADAALRVDAVLANFAKRPYLSRRSLVLASLIMLGEGLMTIMSRRPVEGIA